MKYLTIIILTFGIIKISEAQDMHFSQFYAAPLYLSPSLAGATDGARIGLNYRNQWPGIKTAFTTSAISVDNFFSRFNSGLGFFLIQDKAGSAGLTTTQAAFQYSYNIQITDEWQVVPAIQVSYGNKAIDFSKLIFGDEMNSGGASGSWDKLNNDQSNYVDFATSALLYNPGLWVGLTIDHLAQPNHSFMGEQMQHLRKFVLFGGVNLWSEKRRFTKEERSFATSFRIQHQRGFNQADMGLYWFNDPIEVGVWYRGLPMFSEVKNKLNQDALVFLLSYRYGPIRFGYSYDITINDLGWQSAGANEISVIYEFNQNFQFRKGRRPAVPCSDTGNPLTSDFNNRYRKRKR